MMNPRIVTIRLYIVFYSMLYSYGLASELKRTCKYSLTSDTHELVSIVLANANINSHK
jgi:hypothetical protein